jgi:hypothetical protein
MVRGVKGQTKGRGASASERESDSSLPLLTSLSCPSLHFSITLPIGPYLPREWGPLPLPSFPFFRPTLYTRHLTFPGRALLSCRAQPVRLDFRLDGHQFPTCPCTKCELP